MHSRVERTLDTECYRDYWLARFEDRHDPSKVYRFAMWPGQRLDIEGLRSVLAWSTIATFNGIGYDIPMTMLALQGVDNMALKQANDMIIERRLSPWDFMRSYGLEIPDWLDHIDLMEVAPGVKIGLKTYMARMHCKQLQDLPIDPKDSISPANRVNLDFYCGNDHDGTRTMWNQLAERLTMREDIGKRYGIDVRSKSDAQIAEAVFKAKLGRWIDKRYVPHGFTFMYQPPSYIKFATPELQAMLATLKATPFEVQDKEEALLLYGDAEGIRTGVRMPKFLAGKDIRIGNSCYRMGIGGLHSQEHGVTWWNDEHCELSDHDVASYYPALIINSGKHPTAIGPEFQPIYIGIRDERIIAKAEKNKVYDGGLKIVLNGTFGKLFSKYSIFYEPEMGIYVTITGQLSLLMLIEMLELSGIHVVSANTDGIVVRCPRDRIFLREQIMAWWMGVTGLVLEHKLYRSIHMRDVNNYVAITMDGEAKRKGIFAKPGLIENKHPDKSICAEAVVQYLLHKTPVAHTIRECQDIREFVVARAVKGGGQYKGQYLGKSVRWYYGKTEGHIEYVSNGNKVAGSDFATPCMRLPDALPNDINYAHYSVIAEEMLDTIMPIPF